MSYDPSGARQPFTLGELMADPFMPPVYRLDADECRAFLVRIRAPFIDSPHVRAGWDEGVACAAEVP